MPKGEQGAGSRGGGKAGKPTAYQVQKYNKGETINIRKEEAIRTRLASTRCKGAECGAALSAATCHAPNSSNHGQTSRLAAWSTGWSVRRFAGLLVCWLTGWLSG